jgi:hypothetical protein
MTSGWRGTQLCISAVAKAVRFASWIRQDHPDSAPDRGHSYLIALCGIDGPDPPNQPRPGGPESAGSRRR